MLIRFLLILLALMVNTSFAGDEIWVRQTASFKMKKLRLRPEHQHRMEIDQKMKANVYRLNFDGKFKPLQILGSVASFNRYKKEQETRLALGIGRKKHRLIYEQRFIGDMTKARLRYRTQQKLIKHIKAYQELFYDSEEKSVNEWRLGANISQDFGQIEGLFRFFVVMEKNKEPSDVVMFGLNYKL